VATVSVTIWSVDSEPSAASLKMVIPPAPSNEKTGT
jgi:hypothetical protein